MNSFRGLQNYTTLKLTHNLISGYGSFRGLQNYTTLKPSGVKSGMTPVLEVYRITLLSNAPMLSKKALNVLEVYRITLLSN